MAACVAKIGPTFPISAICRHLSECQWGLRGEVDEEAGGGGRVARLIECDRRSHPFMPSAGCVCVCGGSLGTGSTGSSII